MTQFHISLCHCLVQDMINELLQLHVIINYTWDQFMNLYIHVRFQFHLKLVIICKEKSKSTNKLRMKECFTSPFCAEVSDESYHILGKLFVGRMS